MVTALRRFKRDQQGLALVEGLITLPLLVFVISVFVEFGYGVYQWNETSRAIAHGARLAAVSSPVATDFATLDDDMTGLLGVPVPATTQTVTCVGAGSRAKLCDTLGFERLLKGSDRVCNRNFGVSTPGICDFNPRIGAENVKITYTRAGLGYQGRRLGPVVSVTVELQDLYFRLLLAGALIDVLTPGTSTRINFISIPASPATYVGEDLANCATPLVASNSTFANPC